MQPKTSPLHYYHHYNKLLLFNIISKQSCWHAMEETVGSTRRLVSSFNPNTMTYTTFSRKYAGYLLPALLKAAANGGTETTQFEKFVRYEVDMALALSTDDQFKWSRALKSKLEESLNTSKHRMSSKCRSKIGFRSHSGILKGFEHLQTFAVIPRPIVVVEARPRKASQRSVKKRAARGDGELACRIRILRRILPGGKEMGVLELLSEVQSYLVFLKLQVDVLRSLVDAE